MGDEILGIATEHISKGDRIEVDLLTMQVRKARPTGIEREVEIQMEGE